MKEGCEARRISRIRIEDYRMAEKIKSADTSLEEEIYYCVGDSTLKIAVYGELYVVIDEETYKAE